MNQALNSSWKRHAIGDTGIATLALFSLYAVAQGVQSQPLQLPGYILMVVFDLVDPVFGAVGANFDVLFGMYLLGLGVLGGVAAGVFRSRSRDSRVASWRYGIAGALAVTGSLALLFGVGVFLGASQVSPALIGVATGLALLGLAGFLAGLLGTTEPSA